MSEIAQSIAIWTVLTALLAAAMHLGIVLAIPQVVGYRLRSMAPRNTILHTPKPTVDYNPIRRASPDLIYSACPYDLSAGPLRVTAPVSGTYMSVSCFASNTDNFYAKNDRHVETSFDFVLVGPGTQRREVLGTDIVRSPTTTGGIIIRYFVGDGTQEEQIESIRREIQISQLSSDEQPE